MQFGGSHLERSGTVELARRLLRISGPPGDFQLAGIRKFCSAPDAHLLELEGVVASLVALFQDSFSEVSRS